MEHRKPAPPIAPPLDHPRRTSAAPALSVIPAPFSLSRHSISPSASLPLAVIPAPPSVIPACAGRNDGRANDPRARLTGRVLDRLLDDLVQSIEISSLRALDVEAVKDAAEARVAVGLGEPHPFDSRLIERLDGLDG